MRPILQANCVHCHTYPAIGGAPRNFRLDVYDSTVTDHGDVIYGASTVAEYICRHTKDGTMPPRFPLTKRQRVTLERWYSPKGCNESRQEGELPPRGDSAPGNRSPSFALLRPLDESVGEDGRLTIAYEIEDPDFDVVTGALVARSGGGDDIVVTRELHGGRGEAIWDVAAEAEGTYELVARLRDGSGEGAIEREVGSFEVEHPDGNTAPRVTIRTTEDRSDLPLGPMQDVLISDADSPFDLVVEIVDPDAGGPLTLTLVAIRSGGVEELVLAEEIPAQPGENIIRWDTSEVTQSANWQLRATVREGDVERTHTTLPFIVGHGTTDLIYGEEDDEDLTRIREILGNCFCHGEPAFAPPEILHNFGRYGRDDTGDVVSLGVGDLKGTIYRRAIQQRTMPPGQPLSEQARATLAEWLLAGAPEVEPAEGN